MIKLDVGLIRIKLRVRGKKKEGSIVLSPFCNIVGNRSWMRNLRNKMEKEQDVLQCSKRQKKEEL